MRANRLFDDGQFAEAAGIFEQLADGAEQGGMLVRAAQLSLQAARAHLAMDGAEAALARSKRAIRLLSQAGRADRIPLLLDRASQALRSKGYAAEADELEREAAEALQEMGLSLEEARRRAPTAPQRRGTLAAKCGGCGAPLTPEGVEWHDGQTAECPYCGTIAKTS